MKISYNWLRQYIDTKLDAEEVAGVLTSIGLEVESVETIESIPGGLKGVVVGEVVECVKHPDADKLSLTKVDLGNGEPVQIVCGAPNVAIGQKVLVATVGTKLFPKGGDSFNIKKSKIRGEESNGMICAEDELGLGESHAGIMILDTGATPGTPAAEYLELETDHRFEIGLTPNRTDAISHYGVARDLAAALRNMEGRSRENVMLQKPIIETFREGEKGKGLRVEVEAGEACPRYCGLTIEGVKVGPSPRWLHDRLVAIGQRPVNNVVDITNYVQHEMGQPLHAFDAGSIAGKSIIVRMAREGEKFVALDSIERTLSGQDLVIADSEKPLCIAGVFGGIQSGVQQSTTSVFLESAYFNPRFIRKTARRHSLNTDASFRFERGCDPQATVWALKRAALMIEEIAGGKTVSAITDIYPSPIENARVSFRWNNAASLIGINIDREKIKSILRDLEIEIVKETESYLELSIPPYRTDVTREADVVEEVLRIYGYNNVDIPARMFTSLSHSPKPDPEKLRESVSLLLTANGFAEIMGMSLTKTSYPGLLYTEGNTSAETVALVNPLSNDLAVMRESLLFSGLESVAINQNHRHTDLRLYEFGKTYSKQNGKYREQERLSVLMSGRNLPESWNNTNDLVSFSGLRGVVQNVLAALGIRDTTFSAVQDHAFGHALDCRFGKTHLARLGNVSANLLKVFDIRQPVWFADVCWENLVSAIPSGYVRHTEAEKFPAVRRDLSLLLDSGIEFAQIENIALETERKLLRAVNLFDVYEGKAATGGKKSYAVSFLLQDKTKTMTDAQVENVMARIQKNLEEKLGAKLRT